MIQTGLDVAAIRREFPILGKRIHGKPLAYLDNGATSQKPLSVLQAVDTFSRDENASVHRGVHLLSQEATAMYEGVRTKAAHLLGASSPREIVFTKGCTESINLVAFSFGRMVLKPGDRVVLTEMEHHSNIVPWQMIAEQTGAEIVVVPLGGNDQLDLEAYRRILAQGAKIVAFTHISNVLGTVNPVREMIAMAKEVGAFTLVDGAQAVPHTRVNVQDLGADFYVFSPHKAFAPTGVGVLYGRADLLEKMPPYQGGGSMIRTVAFERTTYAEPPARFEAGTPNVQGVAGLGAAIDYLMALDWEAVARHEAALVSEAERLLQEIPGVRLIGRAPEKCGIVSWVQESAHAHDVGTILDAEGVAIRVGHHCCMPLMKVLGVPATARASFAIYNTSEEVQRLAHGVCKVNEVFG